MTEKRGRDGDGGKRQLKLKTVWTGLRDIILSFDEVAGLLYTDLISTILIFLFVISGCQLSFKWIIAVWQWTLLIKWGKCSLSFYNPFYHMQPSLALSSIMPTCYEKKIHSSQNICHASLCPDQFHPPILMKLISSLRIFMLLSSQKRYQEQCMLLFSPIVHI